MKILVDTNILLRSVQLTHRLKPLARAALRRLYDEGNHLYVTPQNIAEFWNVCTRPESANGLGYSIAETDRLTSRIEYLFVVLPDSFEAFRVWRRLVVTNQVKGAKVHDVRLAAIMRVHDVGHLLTFNIDDFKRFDGITALDPRSLL